MRRILTDDILPSRKRVSGSYNRRNVIGHHSNNDGTHTSSCNCGLEVKNITCLDNDGDGKCDSCGYVKYTKPEGEHEHNYVAHSNNDGTHTSSCNCGLEVKITCLDNDGDGKCDSCGYVKYTQPEGEHEHNYVAHSNNDGTHTSSCNCGLEVKNITCLDNDGDGKCDSCGYVKYPKPDCDHSGTQFVKDNGDGKTHKVTCACGVVMKEAEAHTYGLNGVCACGAIHNCHYDAGVTSNNDGTHNINCSCGDYVQVGCLDNDGDGKCDSCGYVKYVAPEAKPDKNYGTAGLDNVPRTGNILLEWLYALFLG